MTISINILESAISFFDTSQRKQLRALANEIATLTAAAIAADPSVINLELDDLTDVDAPSPANGDQLRFATGTWLSFGPAFSYTPSMQDSTNTDAITPADPWWVIRIGTQVIVSGVVNIDPTASGNATFVASLPVASTATVAQFLNGVGSYVTAGGASQVATITGSLSPQGALFTVANSGTAAFNLTFTFVYTTQDAPI